MLVIKKLTRYTCRLSNLCASRKINAVLKVRLAVGPPSADADCWLISPSPKTRGNSMSKKKEKTRGHSSNLESEFWWGHSCQNFGEVIPRYSVRILVWGHSCQNFGVRVSEFWCEGIPVRILVRSFLGYKVTHSFLWTMKTLLEQNFRSLVWFFSSSLGEISQQSACPCLYIHMTCTRGKSNQTRKLKIEARTWSWLLPIH